MNIVTMASDVLTFFRDWWRPILFVYLTVGLTGATALWRVDPFDQD